LLLKRAVIFVTSMDFRTLISRCQLESSAFCDYTGAMKIMIDNKACSNASII